MSRILDRRTRGIALQVSLLLVLGLLIWWLASNAIANLERQNIASGFGFLSRTAGFDISQSLITYSNTDTYARAFWVGLLNTLLVAVIGIIGASALGFALGLARLSSNWLLAKLALTYVEVVRNVPLLLWLFVIYFGVMLRLPAPAQSWHLPFGGLLNQRGLAVPLPVMSPAWQAVMVIALASCVLAIALWTIRGLSGSRWFLSPWSYVVLGLAPATLAAALACRLPFDTPHMGRFNLEGGGVMLPELMALLIGLVTYTAAYICEIVRAGLLSVPEGQRQAAAALGLSARDTTQLIVVPQALRAIIPPLTNQYVNLAKNSSLAVAVGYPDLVSVFAGTILNHTNQAVETIAITMSVYLAISLTLAAGMNALNARVALVER
jgi:general L-amino acid transport system permease protein